MKSKHKIQRDFAPIGFNAGWSVFLVVDSDVMRIKRDRPMKMMSKDEPPFTNEIQARLDLFDINLSETYQGGVLIAGEDSLGVVYEPKEIPDRGYSLPSGSQYTVPKGDTLGIYFSFELFSSLHGTEILERSVN